MFTSYNYTFFVIYAVQIISYYIIFYGVLAAFWAICMVVFLHTLDDYAPTQQHKYSLLKDNPGLYYLRKAGASGVNIDLQNNVQQRAA